MAIEKIDILLLGAGGREHALLKKLSESPRAGKLWVAPGNGGMLQLADVAPVNQEDAAGVAAWAAPTASPLVSSGHELPGGRRGDAVRARWISCFGPNGSPPPMEGWKKFATVVMARANVADGFLPKLSPKTAAADYVRQLRALVARPSPARGKFKLHRSANTKRRSPAWSAHGRVLADGGNSSWSRRTKARGRRHCP
jgi:phosphoribosylamine--glycine ligase